MPKNVIQITAVGDICLSDHILCSGFGVKSTIGKYGKDYLFQNVKEYFQDSDIVFANLECVLSNKNLDANDIRSTLFRGSPEYIDILKKAGFNILNIANNHSMQHGFEAFNDMKMNLQKNSIHPLGIKDVNNLLSLPVIFDITNIKIAFIGYSLEKDKYSDDELPYAKGDLSNIKKDISDLKKLADIIIVSVHWGLELMLSPSNNTIKLARQIIDSGADIILGHHSHTLQGIERYKDKLINYSLGNFVFDLLWDTNARRTGIFKIYIDSTKNITYKFIPVFINNHNQPIITKDSSESLISNTFTQDPDKDIEHENLRYYLETCRLEKQLVYKKLLFVFKNIGKINKKALSYLMREKLKTLF
jgi:gamma-polyglutamate biosynthesis protein CapA